jgi:hypothetical protein
VGRKKARVETEGRSKSIAESRKNKEDKSIGEKGGGSKAKEAKRVVTRPDG